MGVSRARRLSRRPQGGIQACQGVGAGAIYGIISLNVIGKQAACPMQNHNDTTTMADSGRDGGTQEATSMDTGLSGLKVMVIDDSKTIRRTAETLLKKEGCEVITATDGFEALAKIADTHPDIIFVDIMMPRLDGYQTCALIKHNQVFRETPVIMLSSKDGLFDRARGRIVGSDQYLTKPFTKEELLGAIKDHVTVNA
jgi:twitching motility two-component system response regulator PilG